MILVTGMHRSGTSLVAMTMETLGISFGPQEAFYEADRWNARGYFERRDVMDINNRMITGLPRTKSGVSAVAGQMRYLMEPNLHRILGRGPQFQDDMRTVSNEIGSGAVKDPRLCLTWSAWAERVDIESCVLSVRHPLEVADSLRRRQRIPLSIGLRFWRYHIRALREITPTNLLVVSLDSLIEQPGDEIELLIDRMGLEIDPKDGVTRFRDVYAPGMTKRTPPSIRPTLEGETAELWNWISSFRTSATAGKAE